MLEEKRDSSLLKAGHKFLQHLEHNLKIFNEPGGDLCEQILWKSETLPGR